MQLTGHDVRSFGQSFSASARKICIYIYIYIWDSPRENEPSQIYIQHYKNSLQFESL